MFILGKCMRLAILSTVLLLGRIALAQALLTLPLVDPDPEDGRNFGHRVAASGDFAFVSENPAIDALTAARVHVFNRVEGGFNAWGLTQSISCPDGDGLGFGYGLYAWGDRLAIYRAPHSSNYLGATVCKARTVFMFRLNDSGQWVQDGIIGGEILSSGPCSIAIEGNAEHTMDAEGDVIIITSNHAGLLGEAYERTNPGNWQLAFTTPVYFHYACVTGDTIIYYQGPDAIGFARLSGEDLPSLFLPGISGGSSCCRNLDVFDGLLAIGQVTGELGDYSMGRVLFRNTALVGYPASDTIMWVGSSAFAGAIRFAGDMLVVQEGGWLLTPIRFVVYQRNGNASDNWTLIHVIPMVESFPEGVHLPKFDLTNDGLMITSVRQPLGPGVFETYEVSIWDLSVLVGVPEVESASVGFIAHRNGQRVYVCDNKEKWESDTQVYIHDVTGRMLASSNITTACTFGIDLAHIPSGIYVIELRSQESRASIKLQW